MLTGIARSARPEIVGQQITPPDQEPTVEWSSSPSADPARQAKSKRYDGLSLGRIAEMPSDVQVLPVNVHWWKGISALPVAQSDAIVLGYILNSNAYLSDNRGAIYSEFSVRTLQVLKDSGPKSVTAGSTIVAERLGGTVIFPSGKVQHYRISRQGFPRTNREYILFLKSNGEDYDLVTGYLIDGGQVSPLDGGADLPFAKYAGNTVDHFLSELRVAINTSTTKGPEKK
jgi:hypothetical protein